MVLELTSQYLSTQVTAIHSIPGFVLTGEGSFLRVYDNITGGLFSSVKVFTKVSVHGICHINIFNKLNENIEDSLLILVHGQRSFALLTLNTTNGLCSLLVSEQVSEDWVVCGKCLIATLDAKVLTVQFVLLTAHSALLLYSLYNDQLQQHDACKLPAASKYVYQVLEEKDIDAKYISCTRLCVIAKVQCNEKSVLFSGNIRLPEIASSLALSKTYLQSDLSRNTARSKEWIKSLWKGLVCFGGTAFGTLIIWGTNGDATNEGCITPWHIIKGHRGVVFSISWCSTLQAISTTSDDRTVKVWNISLPNKCLHSSSDDSKEEYPPSKDIFSTNALGCWKCSKLTLKGCYEGHQARVWRSLIITQLTQDKTSQMQLGCNKSLVLSVGEDSNICIWGENEETPICCWRAHAGASIWSVSINIMNGKLIVITGGADGAVKRWSLENLLKNNFHQKEYKLNCLIVGKPQQCSIGKLYGSQIATNEVALATDKLKTLSTNPVNQENGNEYECIKKSFVRSLCLLNAQQSLLCFDNGQIWLWNLSNLISPNLCNSSQECSPNSVKHHDSKLAQDETASGHSLGKTDWVLVKEEADKLRGYSIMTTDAASHITAKPIAIGGLFGHVFIIEQSSSGHVICTSESQPMPGKVFAARWLSHTELLLCYNAGKILRCSWSTKTKLLSTVSVYELPVCKQRWFTSACRLSPSHPTNISADCLESEILLLVGDRHGSLHLYSGQNCIPVATVRNIHGNGGVTSVTNYNGSTACTTGRDGWIRYWHAVQEGNVATLRNIHGSRHMGGGNWTALCIPWLKDNLVLAFHDVFLQVWSEVTGANVAQVECGGGHRAWDVALMPLKTHQSLIKEQTSSEADLICVFLKDGLPRCSSVRITSQLTPFKVGLSTKAVQCCTPLLASKGETVVAVAGEDCTLRLVSVSHSDGSCRPLTAILSHISAIRTVAVIEHQVIEKEQSDVWFVSAGGRAQLKVWRLRDALSKEDIIECTEDFNHQLIEESSNTSWRLRKTKVSPETRHMDCAAVWLSQSSALVAVGSSDAILRLYELIQEEDGSVSLEPLCEAQRKNCFLSVNITIASIDGEPTFLDCIIRTTDTAGYLIHWVLNLNKEEESTSEDMSCTHSLQKISEVLLHPAGINSIAALPVCSTSSHDGTDHTTREMVLTGGDDNVIVLSLVSTVVRAVSGLSTLTDRSDVSVTVTPLARTVSHCAQVTGLQWVSSDKFLSASIDQRIILWELKRDQVSSSLQALGSVFSSVSDIQGLILTCSSKSKCYSNYKQPRSTNRGNEVIAESNDNDSAGANKCVGGGSVQCAVYGTGFEVFAIQM